MANLAIIGHATRGKEVIEILEMLGGVNRYHRKGNVMSLYYYIGSTTHIYSANEILPTEYFVFTLEEFLEKFPYKVGDKVLLNGVVKTIKQACWDNTENEVIYKLETNVRGFSEEYYVHHYDLQPYKEETMEENIKEKCDLINFNSHYIFNFADRVELILKDGWEVKNEDGRTYVVKKKSKYPKTYEECCDVLSRFTEYDLNKKRELLLNVHKLIKCRDAYWKIAGEQMGLGKPWEPDFTNDDEERYGIYTAANKVVKDFCGIGDVNVILTFPTEEMRDAFYENFKDLIIECKELL